MWLGGGTYSHRWITAYLVLMGVTIFRDRYTVIFNGYKFATALLWHCNVGLLLPMCPSIACMARRLG